MLDKALYIYHPELLRLDGELIRAETPDRRAAAEDRLQEAIEVSRRQQARTQELRATVSLGRLWQAQGKARQAHRVVKDLYDQFSEGFDTADLRHAATFLDETAGRPT